MAGSLWTWCSSTCTRRDGDARTGVDLVRAMAGEPLRPLCACPADRSLQHAWSLRARRVDYLLKPFTEERVELC